MDPKATNEGSLRPEPRRRNLFEKIQNLILKIPVFRVFSALIFLGKALSGLGSKAKAGEAAGSHPPGFFGAFDAKLKAFFLKLPGPLSLLSRYYKLIAGFALALAIALNAKPVYEKYLKKGVKSLAPASLEDVVAKPKEAQEDAPIPIKGFKVGRFNFEDSLNALGTIKGAVEFKLSFEIPGTVSSINYREGERYEEGALLISLRQDDILLRLKRAQAELRKAETQTEIATEKVKEHEKLYAMGAIAKTTLENVKLEEQSARFDAEAARLEAKANEAMLEKSNLYAPSAGMIGELNIEEGEAVSPNTLLGTHIMTEYVYAEFGVVEREVNKIALGQKARVFVDAFPDKTLEGVIENVAPVVAGTSRTATARVRIENPERLLLPGMFARIRILLYSKKNTLVIPTDSVQGKEGEQFVYVVHSNKQESEAADAQVQPEPDSEKPQDNEKAGPKQGAGDKEQGPEGQADEAKKPKPVETVEKRAITVGYTRPDYSQIDAGVSEGEIIAISNLERLEDGRKVRLIETQEAEV